MSEPAVFIPVITDAGLAAAIAASNDGLQLKITHASFGIGQYDPTGAETSLFNEVKRIPVTGAMRPKPNQMRIAGAWSEHAAESEIGEIGFWADGVLVAVWSRATGGPIGFKTIGVDFVAFCELLLDRVPVGSVIIEINPDVNQAISQLVLHEVDTNAHPYYLLRADFVNAHALMTAEVVDMGDTVNDVLISLPAETVVLSYEFGQTVMFVANHANTGAMTVDINGLGAVAVTKGGGVPLNAGEVEAGAVYTLFYDGSRFQVSGGIGNAATMSEYIRIADDGQTVFTANYSPSATLVSINGRLLPSTDYVAADGEVITLNTPAELDDVIKIVTFRAFTVADVYTKAVSDERFLTRFDAETLVPVGAYMDFAHDNLEEGWFFCNGALVSRTAYPELFAKIGTRYGAGDGSTTFRLPDVRGLFKRCVDAGRGVDPSRLLGSSQKASLMYWGNYVNNVTSGIRVNGASGRSIMGVDPVNEGDYIGVGLRRSSNAFVASNGNLPFDYAGAVRPANIAVYTCIRWRGIYTGRAI